MLFRRKFWGLRAAGFLVCKQGQLFAGHQNRGQSVSLGACTVTTASDRGRRQRPKGKVNNEDRRGTTGGEGTLRNEGLLSEALPVLNLMEKRGVRVYSDYCASLLQDCAAMKALADGKGVHAHIVKSGLKLDIFLGNTLVSMYVKCGSVVDARQVFDKMPRRNVISWTAMITGLAQEGHGEEAFKLFQQMQSEGVKPNQITFMSVLNACGSPVTLEQSKRLHSSIINAGLESDVRVGTALVSMYCKYGRLVDARQVFQKLRNRDVVSWTAMIAGIAQQGHVDEAFELFEEMQREGVQPNKITFISILNACASPAALEHGKRLHAGIIKAEYEPDCRVGNALVSMYCKCGSVVNARQVFNSMTRRDVVSWTAMIAGSAQHGQSAEALELFQEMQREGMTGDKITFISVLNACMNPADLERGKQLHESVIKSGFDSDGEVECALARMYCRCESLVDARKVFDKMPKRDLSSWNAIIAGSAQHGPGEEVFILFQQMQRESIKPDKVTFISILKACISLGALEEGRQLHADIVKMGFESDVRVGNTLISMYCKCGSVANARQVFDKLLQRDVVSWTAMIAGSAQQRHGEEAFELYREMQEESVKPDTVTFTSILNVCADLAALEEGKWIHTHIIKCGLESDVCVGNALVDMYFKCGSVEDALHVFARIRERDVISWTTMITGYAQHGHGKEGLRLFQQMQREGVKPNEVTFIGVLSACSHMGLVDEGHHYFLSMSRDYGITPSGKHYGCMVDLLGRAGLLEEAEHFVNQMPCQPGAPVWGALLGACSIHGNVELAERVAQYVLKLEPQDASVYVLLSNIYSVAGRWEEVAKVRKVMEEKSLKKEPGRSWIKIKNRVHSFVAEDRSHPQSEDIYAELERLTRQIKERGYVADTRYAMHNVGQQMQEEALCHHSEKLAISFGLISTPPGTPIRIIKNLRVCGDCHMATKFISKIVEREIVARDANRFHHFKNGVCSCGDYW